MIGRPEIRLGRPVFFGEAYFAATPMDQGLRLAGSAEFSRAETLPNMKRAYMLQRLDKQYLPGLSAKTAQPWMGVRPSLPDGVPAIGQVKGEPRTVLCFWSWT